jgi:TatD DNase family protein
VNSLTDTHCHLDFRAFDTDREEVLKRCQEAGVTRMLNPGVDLETSRAAVHLAEKHPEIYAAVGVHPNDGGSWNETTAADLRSLADHPRVVAIGEIGLDFYRNTTEHSLQVRIFREQLDLAAELGLPVIIHARQALRETLDILAAWRDDLMRDGSALADQPGVLHSFEGDLELALQALEMNFYLGVGGPVTFRNAPEKRALLSAIPLDVLLLETDAPFLAPVPHRGERNEPSFIRWVADTLATLTNTPISSVARVTSNNAASLFAWRETV